MEKTNIILENEIESVVRGIYYIYNSKYYFIYTKDEIVDENYVQLYVVKVCKEIQNTQSGPIDTGNMLGIKISDSEEWSEVQNSITKIVNNKKSGVQDNEVHYLSINMLVNLKIISKNLFKLTKDLFEKCFNSSVDAKTNSIVSTEIENEGKIENFHSNNLQVNTTESTQPKDIITPDVQPIKPIEQSQINSLNTEIGNYNSLNSNNYDTSSENDVIIDYRTKFFEEQDKTKELEEQIRILNEKLNSIKQILNT